MTFASASEACSNKGGALVAPRTLAENQRLTWESVSTGEGSIWVGASDVGSEGTWLNSEGAVVWTGSVSGAAPGETFTAWDQEEPNLHDCAVLKENATWGTVDCATLSGYACRLWRSPLADCGNRIVDPGEVCDEGSETEVCDVDCTVAKCGDGYRNRAAGEECDEGHATASCGEDCTSTGLAAHFPLTERRGTVAYDAAGWVNRGVLVGDAKFADAGDGVVFDGGGVAVAETPVIAGTITWMVFAQAEEVPVGIRNLLEIASDTEATFFRFRDLNLEVGSWQNTSQWTQFDMTSTLTLGEFVHLAGRYDGSKWQLFVDGQLVSETAAPVGAVAADGAFVFGGRQDLSRGFVGKLLDVRVYARSLSDEEIEAISRRER